MLRVNQDEVSCTALETDMLPGDVKLWSNGEVEESPEEIETPMPVAFGPVLAFMETSYDEARAEYFNMLKDHIGEQLARCPQFVNILKSELCVDRFVTFRHSTRLGRDPSTRDFANMRRRSLSA